MSTTNTISIDLADESSSALQLEIVDKDHDVQQDTPDINSNIEQQIAMCRKAHKSINRCR